MFQVNFDNMIRREREGEREKAREREIERERKGNYVCSIRTHLPALGNFRNF